MISGNLFTRDYLLEGIARTEQWKSLTDKEFQALKCADAAHQRPIHQPIRAVHYRALHSNGHMLVKPSCIRSTD